MMGNNVVEFTIRGIDKASGPVSKFSKTLGGTVKVVAKIAAGVVGLTGAFSAFNIKVASSIDKQVKFARRLGESITELTALQHAAGQSGINVETFNMALQRMSRRVGEAAQGTGEAKLALAQLGINARTFSSLPLTEKMVQLNAALAEFPKQSDRLRLAFKLFDSEGVAMLQMLDGNSEAMKQLIEDANFLGLAVGKQLAADSEVLTNEVGRMKGAFKGVSNTIASEFIPLISGLTKQFTDFVASNRDNIGNWVKGSAEAFLTIAIVAKQAFDGIKKGIIDTLTTKVGFQTMVDNAKATFTFIVNYALNIFPLMAKALLNSFKVAFEGIKELGVWAWENIKAVFTDAEGPSLADLLFERLPQATAEARAELTETLSGIEDLVLSTGETVSSTLMDMLGINIKLAKEQANEIVSSLRLMGKVAEEENKKMQETVKTFMDYFREVHEAFLKQQLPMLQEMANSFYNILQGSISLFSSNIANALVEIQSLGDAIKATFKEVLKQIIATLIQMGIQRLIISNLFAVENTRLASQDLARGLASTYLNAFASTAAIPIVGPALAPGVAAAAQLTASAGTLAAAAQGAGLGFAAVGGIAHGGMTNVPRESTFILDRGERVLSPRQNKDLTQFLNGGSESTGFQGDINLSINITGDRFSAMTDTDIKELVARKLYPAMRKLKREGIKV